MPSKFLFLYTNIPPYVILRYREMISRHIGFTKFQGVTYER